jgi:hypothetical protein
VTPPPRRPQNDVVERDIPPSMRNQIKHFLYAKTIKNIPIFKGLSDEVISALCCQVVPMYSLAGETIVEEGKPGSELYMLMQGEMEVLQKDNAGVPRRLGFLSEVRKTPSCPRSWANFSL